MLTGKSQRILWTPQSKPQWEAVLSLADEVFYGGQAGGGKTDLLIGVAFTQHQRAAIFRRISEILDAIVDRSIEIMGDDVCYNRTSKVWNLPGLKVEFESCQYEKDKKKQQGRPRDFYGFDEITEFTQSQFVFITGWNRTTDPHQRCRVIVTGNPPTDSGGAWVIDEWAPWLDRQHPDPAEPGELRWYYRDGENLVWLKSGDPVEVEGQVITPRSRTFIPAALEDNPYLSQDDRYRTVLQSLPEPLRSQLMNGDFSAAAEDDPWQVIPTAWVLAAQRRWRESDKPDMLMTQAGVDPSRGGANEMVIAWRLGNWFNLKGFPGKMVPDGPTAAALILQTVDGKDVIINVDATGIGSSVYDSCRTNGLRVVAVHFAGATKRRDKSGRLNMKNVRAAMYWKMREDLDPEFGQDLMLPPGRQVLADLCSPRYKLTTSGIQLESKDEIKKRLGRSPDYGDALVLANFQVGGVILG